LDGIRAKFHSGGSADTSALANCLLALHMALLTRAGPLSTAMLGVFAEFPQLLLMLHATVLEPRFHLETENFTLVIASECMASLLRTV